MRDEKEMVVMQWCSWCWIVLSEITDESWEGDDDDAMMVSVFDCSL